MTKEIALQILGMESTSTLDEIKKKYRKLMLLTHPDMGESCQYPYDASQINVAYDFLLKNYHLEEIRIEHKESSRIRWNAPINPNAYATRPIYHYVEDSDGQIIGQATIDEGPYIWTSDEEFKLFLKSILYTARKVISESDVRYGRNRSNDMLLLKELSYLLAQQYVDTDMVLSLLAQADASEQIYRIDAMVEIEPNEKRVSLSAGDSLFPSKISHHKLYVKDNNGNEIGYLSFHDDRLYYGIIPLFEWRAAMVKIIVKDSQQNPLNRNIKNSSKKGTHKYIGKKNYLDIDLQIKLDLAKKNFALDSINLRIEKMLKERRSY